MKVHPIIQFVFGLRTVNGHSKDHLLKCYWQVRYKERVVIYNHTISDCFDSCYGTTWY